ncbi:MOSC domain-containing protein [Proteiniborus sp. DW1]|nr:MOSC domain-containing protein [Proteiniborus sp. DW1]
MELDFKQATIIGKVTAIYLCDPKEMTLRSVEEGVFKENHGLIGDKHSFSGDRQVTLFSAEGRNRIETIEADGLCVRKFYENLTVQGLDASKLVCGRELVIGESIFQITAIGKRCFLDCNIVKRTEACSLRYGVVFAKVILGGRVRVGDEVLLRE